MAFECPEKSPRSNFKYDFDWLLALKDLLPILRRKTKIFSYFGVPFKYLWNSYLGFLQTRCETLFETAATGQTISIEKLLNELFDKVDQEILVENIASNFETLFVYQRDETPAIGDDIYVYKRGEFIPPSGNQEYIFRKEEVELNVDFIVKIPSLKWPHINTGEVSAVVDKYKFVGTTYRIEQY